MTRSLKLWPSVARLRNLLADRQRLRQDCPRSARFIDCFELEDRVLLSAAPIGTETLVNTTTAGTQQSLNQAAVASDANGNYVVAWASQGQDGSGWGIYAQRYNSAGAKQGSEFQVNTTTSGDQLNPAIAMSSSGTFVITWSDQSSGDWDIRAQRFDASGSKLGSEFVVNTATTGDQEYSDVAMDANGNFVVTWSDDASGTWQIEAQQYDSSGNTVGSQFQVNTDTNSDQYSTVGIDSADNFVITWTSGTAGIQAQQFDWSGSTVGSEFQVNSTSAGTQEFSRIAMNSSGAFVVTFQDLPPAGGATWDIYARAYDSSATALGNQFRVNTTTSGNQENPTAYMNPAGDFTIAWSDDSTGNWNIKTQEYDATATAVGSETLINTTTSGTQWYPSLDYQTGGQYVVVWSGNGSGDASGVFMQRYQDGFNQPPVNNVPAAQSTNENTPLVFSTANGNGVSISDSDAGSGSEQVTLSVNDGTLTLASTSGLSFSSGTGSGDATMTFTGTLTNINAALNGLSYTPTSGYTGGDTLQISTNDQGNTGYGTAQTTNTSLAITVVPYTDQAPVVTVPGAQSTNENTPLVFSSTNSNAISVSDVDADGQSEQVTLSVSDGTLSLASTSGLTFSTGTGSGDTTMTFTGTLTNINAALNGLSYVPTSSYTGADTLAIAVNDLGNTGGGGAQITNSSVGITVNAYTDQAPVNTVPVAQSTLENSSLVFSTANGNSISISDADAGSSTEQVTLAVSDGTLTLASTSGLSFSAGTGTGNATMTFTGTLAKINAALNGLTYSPTGSFSGTDTLALTTNDLGHYGGGGPQIASSSVSINVASDVFWMVTQGKVDKSNVPGLNSWDTGDAIELGNPNLSLGAGTTNGTFSLPFSLNSFFAGKTANIDGLEYVTSTITVGGAHAVTLHAGDLILSTHDDETLTSDNTISVNHADVFVFHPDTPGNYSSGTFTYLLKGSALGGADVTDITLVEQATTVGGVTLQPGTFLFIENNGPNNNIMEFVPTDVGQNTTAGTTTTLLNGGPVGLAPQLHGLELVQNNTTIGGVSLSAGQLLLTIDGPANVGSNHLSVNQFDIFALSVTTAGQNPVATASMVMEGNDVGLNQGAEAVQPITLVQTTQNMPPDIAVPATQGTGINAPLTFSIAGGNAITVSDPDADGAAEQVTLSVSDGTLTLGGTSGLTFSSGTGTANTSMTFTGTLSALNTALDGLTYTPNNNYSGSDTLAISVNDLGNTGIGGAKTDNSSVGITVNQVNQPPVNSVPGGQTINENTSLVFSSTNSNAITISDPDADGNPEQVTLSVSDGTLSLAGTNGLVFTTGTGSSDATMTFTGSLADINAALDGLTYTPTANYSGADTLSVTTDDLGNTGTGGAQTANSTVALTINHVNEAPVNTVPGAQSVNENSSLVFSTATSNAVSVGDADSGGNPEQVTLTVSNGTLTLSGTTGLVFSTGSGSGDTTMTFTGTLANINAALDGLAYTPTSMYFGGDTLSVTTNDLGNTGVGGPLTATSTVAITVNEVNQPPVNTVPGAQALNENTSLVFSTATSNAISASDVDAFGNAEQVTLSVSNGTLTLAGTTGLTFGGGTSNGEATMTFSGTLANINAALNGLTYTPTSMYFGSDTLSVNTNDLGNTGLGGPQTTASTVAITVNEVNQPPANTVPGAQSLNENTSLTFSTATSNAISVSDSDAFGNVEQVTLSVNDGTLSLSGTTGLTFSSGTGTGDASMTFTGTLADINAALDGLVYTPTHLYFGNDTLTVATNDLGNTGVGGPLTDTSTVALTVSEVNQPPVNTAPAAQSVDENTSVVFSAVTSNAISVSDVDAFGNTEQVTLSVANGTLTLSGTTGLTFSTGTGTADASMTFSGTLANINAALDGLVYTPTSMYFGSDTLSVTTNDLGNTGLGGPQSTASTVAITVNEVNQPPVNMVPGAQSLNENTSLVFSTSTSNAISASDVDAFGNAEQVTLSVNNGTLTLSGTTGLTFSSGTGTADASMTFSGTLANINAALDGLAYTPTHLYFGSDTLSVTTNDLGNTGLGGPQTAANTVAITVAEVNQPPVNTVPGTQTLLQYGSLAFSTAGGNAIAVSDLDSGGAAEQVSLSVASGTLSLASTHGLSFSVGSGSHDATMTFTGTLADINAALDGLVYTPTAGFSGADVLHLSTNDLGHTGIGGPLTTASTIGLNVLQVDLAPAISAPASQVAQTTTLVFSTAGGNALSVNEVGPGGQVLQVSLAATSGTVSLVETAGITIVAGDPSGSGQLVISGSQANINAALNGLTFQPSAATASLQIVATDLGAAPGMQTSVANVSISQTPLILLGTITITSTTVTTTAAKDSNDAIKGIDPRLLSAAQQDALAAVQASIQQAPGPHRAGPLNEQQAATASTAADRTANVDRGAGLVTTQDDVAVLVRADSAAARRTAAAGFRRAGLLDPEALWGNIQSIAERLKNESGDGSTFTVGAAAGLTAAFSAGYAIWCLRAGTLLASVLSSLPLWRNFDPLPVLEFWEKKSKLEGDELDDEDEIDLQTRPGREEVAVG